MRLDDVVALIDILFDGNQRCRLVRNSQGALPEIRDRIRPDLLSPINRHKVSCQPLGLHLSDVGARLGQTFPVVGVPIFDIRVDRPVPEIFDETDFPT